MSTGLRKYFLHLLQLPVRDILNHFIQKRRPKIFHFFERLPFILNSFVCHDQIHSAAKTNIPDTGILSFLHNLNPKVMRIFITYSISLTISCTAPPSSTFPIQSGNDNQDDPSSEIQKSGSAPVLHKARRPPHGLIMTLF